MTRPTTGLYVYGGNGFFCQRCDREIKRGENFAEAKWKKYRKKRIHLVCESCAEGITKEWEEGR